MGSVICSETSLKNKWTFESRQNTYWNKPSAQTTLYGVFWTAAASRMDGLMQINTCCVRSGAYEQDLQTLEVREEKMDVR